MNDSYEFSRKDYVIFRIDGTEKLIAVDTLSSKELSDKLNLHKTFHCIPSEYEVEVVPFAMTNEERTIFLDTHAKYLMPLNRLRPVIMTTEFINEKN